MGIHYDYKNTRGEKALRKQQKREDRRARKKQREPVDTNVIPIDKPITLDMLTDPKRND
tara:strand:- start:282 stop:458 length:177 start_codon:yes stop_codon:yes gene_type:complete